MSSPALSPFTYNVADDDASSDGPATASSNSNFTLLYVVILVTICVAIFGLFIYCRSCLSQRRARRVVVPV
jgi:hypothetical protein